MPEKSRYVPCSTISTLIEHKRAYQPNMLKAMCIIASFLCIHLLYVFIEFLDKNITNNMVENSIVVNSSSSDVTVKAKKDISDFNHIFTSKKNNLNNKIFFPYQHDGFAGFNGYQIISDNKFTPVSMSSSKNKFTLYLDVDNEYNDFSNLIYNDHQSSLLNYYEDDNCFPKQKNLIQIAWEIFPDKLRQKEILMSKPDEPAYIKIIKRPDFPIRAYDMKGVVVIVFIITKEGKIVDREIISETPEGYGFKKEVLKALDDAWYRPAKNKGVPIDTKIILTWTICQYCKDEITYSDGLIVR